jgi:hypothetical protein
LLLKWGQRWPPPAWSHDLQCPPGSNRLQQQARFDHVLQEFNIERPHEALAMQTPAEIYRASGKPYRGLPELTYPLHDREVLVTACGRICMHLKRHYDLGFVDLEQKTLPTIGNPFGSRLSPVS